MLSGNLFLLSIETTSASSWQEAKVCSKGLQIRQLLEFRKAERLSPYRELNIKQQLYLTF